MQDNWDPIFNRYGANFLLTNFVRDIITPVSYLTIQNYSKTIEHIDRNRFNVLPKFQLFFSSSTITERWIQPSIFRIIVDVLSTR